jgi:ribonuclease BN (tRNA processing enzyme)
VAAPVAELHVLGAGSILPRRGHGCAGYAVRRCSEAGLTLLDCGPGSVRALAGIGDAGVGVESVRRVVFSHYHPDHCLDLFALLFARRSPFLAGVPELELIGPVGLRRLLDGGARLFGGWVEPVGASVVELGVELEADADGLTRVERGDLRLTAVPNGHTPQAVSWRLDLPGASLAYTGDTPEHDGVADLARGVDLFVAECSFGDDAAVEGHLTPSSAARMAARAGCRRLVLSHFYPDTDPAAAAAVAARTFDGPIETARDGSCFDVA